MISKVEKIIYYYELEIDFHSTFTANDGNLFRELFHKILELVKAKDPSRYVITPQKKLFINDIGFDPSKKLVWGKLRMIRDEFPELIDTVTDVTRDIDAAEDEGIAETTHFLIDYSGVKKILAMEYYQNGAKYLDFVDYVTTICQKVGWVKSVRAFHVIQDVLKDLKQRINNVSEMYVKVSKTNVDALKKIDGDLYESMDVLQDHFEQEYAELRLKFDYTNVTTNQKSTSKIMKLITKLVGNKAHLQTFDTLKIKAEDAYNRNKLEAFNLLIDNLSSSVKVEKREKSRVISSSHMFELMIGELEKTRPRLR